jgi:hypothetical protein
VLSPTPKTAAAAATDTPIPDKPGTVPSEISAMSDEALRPYFNEVMRRKMKLRRANRKERT